MRRFWAVLAALTLLVALLPSTTMAANPNTTFRYAGEFGDLVSYGDASTWSTPDGQTDIVFKLVLPATTTKDVASLRIDRGSGVWDTVAGNGAWAIGVTKGRLTTLLNSANSTFTADLADGLRVYLHLTSSGYFGSGNTVTLTVGYTSGADTVLTLTLR